MWRNKLKYFSEIKNNYKAVENDLSKGVVICPYIIFDWITILSPPEQMLWGELRRVALNFYPEYPINNYFVDFADPHRKIVIEVDSKYHNKEKDEKRDLELNRLGWTVNRIEARDVINQDLFDFIHNLKT